MCGGGTAVPWSRPITPEIKKLVEARHHDPFAVLGHHPGTAGESVVRAFAPDTARLAILSGGQRLPMERHPGTDLFEWRGKTALLPGGHLEFERDNGRGEQQRYFDPYGFPPQLSDYDLHLFGEGHHWHVYRHLGATPRVVDGVPGVLFATWAPNAERASVVGDFNAWDGRCHPMRVRGGSGVWELFIPGLTPGACYKYELRNRATGEVVLKTDPYGQRFEMRPATAAIVEARSGHAWQDGAWMARRAGSDWLHQPLSIYELHLGSWQRDSGGGFLNYRELAQRLVEHVGGLGFTHIELLPVTEHPLDASWGYQSTGFFAPTSRFGTPDDFRYFVDLCHQAGIGVLLDWVPGHFPKDRHALARFDGSALYEHEDPRLGEHREWGTYIFNYGRNEVRNFLLASAMYWLEEFHIDGLRVDAVASMLYRDYSRPAGEWLPNIHGGRENLEAIAFLRELNEVVHARHPGAMVIAEESTAWPMVSRPVWLGGLGFSMKWNMGWMHDTLEYMSRDPLYRSHHHSLLTFSLLYAFNENFVLPFSHDEVVHLKRSLLDKMPGDAWQRFANLRLLYAYLFTHPGKKLLFMGGEFAQGREWNHDTALDWQLLELPAHQGIQRLISDLNRLYRGQPALHQHDFDARGFSWVDCEDAARSVLSFRRHSDAGDVLVICNFTPVPRPGYRVGVDRSGFYRELLNTDSRHYGGSDMGNGGGVSSRPEAWNDRPHSIELTLPPLAMVVLRHEEHP
ncbi:1,4-alpha-glucan branching protein GlgB [Thioalbus denitrificans]|uniref:1,4-alpha-glucan branching protein GlgB n=1 Tax=Thioalbus denitrificans TaxID=547122 RepID=UPI001B87F883